MPKIPYDIMTNQELEAGFWVDPSQLKEKVLEDRKNPMQVLDDTFHQSLIFRAPRNEAEEVYNLDLEPVGGCVLIFPFNVHYLEIQTSVPFGMQCHWNDPEMIPDIKAAMLNMCHMIPGVGNKIKVSHGISDRMKEVYPSFVDGLRVERSIVHNEHLSLEFRNQYFLQNWDEDGLDLRTTLSIADFINLIFLFFLNIPPKYRTDLQAEKPDDPCLSVPKMTEEADE